jgi:thioredoxin reductase
VSEPDPAPRRTLFGIWLGDARARRAVAGERGRRRARRDEAASSDVTRFGPMAAAALAAAAGVAVALWRAPPAAGGSGALALPHRGLGAGCASCHGEADPATSAEAARRACVGCHGPHPSEREGHRALATRGELGCVRCHDVHGDDGGVRWLAATGEGATAVRYGTRGDIEAGPAALVTDHSVTVPLVPLARCLGCHDTARAADPISRCVPPALRDLGGAAPVVCFEEHQRWSARPSQGGVCAAQHGEDRYAAWEAARAVALGWPRPPGGGGRDGDAGSPGAWLAAGAASALAAFVAMRARAGWLRRRGRKAAGGAGAHGALRPADRVRLPVIDAARCLGCYACVDVCPYDVLEVERYVAVVARPDACCGLTLCEQVCPNGSLRIQEGAPIADRPALTDDLESLQAPGIYLAGDVTGLPLIKNAIAQGTRAAERIAASLALRPGAAGDAALDVLIVGAGPAGIAAALRAKELGLRFRVLEQGSVAQSIRSFPRGKLVFDQPLDLPVAGPLWLEECTKEELLAKWTRVVRSARLPIDERRRFVGLERAADGFVVRAEATGGEGEPATAAEYRASRVLFSIGARGSPRRLDLALSEAVESKVFYHLADARSFAGARVLVVGLGDVAMETAIALAHQPAAIVTVCHRGDGFTRGKERNIQELRRLADAGRIGLFWRTRLAGVERESVLLDGPKGRERVANDAVFVLIGTVPPAELLSRAGISPPATPPTTPTTPGAT